MQKNIWIIEDTPASQILLEEIVNLDGNTPVLINSGEEALERQTKSKMPPSLILMDIGLPGINGVETMKKLKRHNTDYFKTPFIAITAHVMKEEVKEYESKGFAKVIQKPLKCAEIRQLIGHYTS